MSNKDKCNLNFKEALKDLKSKITSEDLLKQIEAAHKDADGNTKQFSFDAMEIIKQYQMQTKHRRSLQAQSIVHDEFTSTNYKERIDKSYTSKSGLKDFVGGLRSYLFNEPRPGEANISGHNIESHRSSYIARFDKIFDLYLDGNTMKDKILKKNYRKAVMNGEYTKDAFNYVLSGGKEQVSEEAKHLGEMIITYNKEKYKVKSAAGFIGDALEDYVINQSFLYSPNNFNTPAKKENWVNKITNALIKNEDTFGDKPLSEIRKIVANTADKILEKEREGALKGEVNYHKIVSDEISSRFGKRYGKQRKFNFEPSQMYSLFEEFAENKNILDHLNAEVRSLSTDVAYRNVYGPLALDDTEKFGRHKLKNDAYDMAKAERDKFKEGTKEFKHYQDQMDMISHGVLQKFMGKPLLTEKGVLSYYMNKNKQYTHPLAAEVPDLVRSVALSSKLGWAVLSSVPDLVSMTSRTSEISGKSYTQSAFRLMQSFSKLASNKELREEIFKKVAIPIESSLHLEMSAMSQKTWAGKASKKISSTFRDWNPVTYSQAFLRKVLAHREAIDLVDAVRGFATADKVQKGTMLKYGITENVAKVINEHGVNNLYGTDMVFADMLYVVPDKLIKEMPEFKHIKSVEGKKQALVSTVENYFFQRNRTGVPMRGERVGAVFSELGGESPLTSEFIKSVTPLKGIISAVFEDALNIYRTQINNGVTGKLRIAEFLTYSMAAGYVVVSLKAIKNGETPPDPTDEATLKKVIGSTGLFGPFYGMFVDENETGKPTSAADQLKEGLLSTPVVGLMADITNAAIDPNKGIIGLTQDIMDNDTKEISKKAVNVYRNLPGANLPQVELPMKYFFSQIFQDANPKARENQQKKFQRQEGLLWKQERLGDILN